jgi:multidrug efflux pump subunit AcrA (membrane-fusion protein)
VKRTWIAWIGAAAALLTACASSPAQKPEERRVIASVTTAPVELTELTTSAEAGGVVRARVTALVASRVMAPIVDVRVRAGDHVHRGDVLVSLDARDLHANDAHAQAEMISALESTRAAEADVRAAESAVQLARVTHERVATLQAKRSATAEELDQAVAGLAAAEAHRAGAQARLAAANAGRDAAKAAADAATVTATYATLAAPFDGIVTERNAEPGSMAAPGTPLLTLEDPTTYRLEVRLDEARAAVVAPGGQAAVHLDSHDTTLTGHVTEVASVDPASHSFLAKIDLPATPAIRSGLFGRASFQGPPRQALTIPSAALVRRGQLTFVFVADTDRRVHLRPVSIGAVNDDRVEVLAGVRQGERIVTSPDSSLTDDAGIAGAR